MTNLIDFTKYLENNPRFRYSTVNLYIELIRDLTKRYGISPTIEQLNEFIAYKCKKRQPSVKYAIKEYLKYTNRPEDYLKLVQAKVRNPIRQKNFLSKDQLIDVINSIANPRYHLIGLIQILTGARALEVITIQTKRITLEKYKEADNVEKERIKIIISGKGDKPRPIYLKGELWKQLEPFYNKKDKYLFLSNELANLPVKEFWVKVRTKYKRYLEDLKEAARKCNLHITTHDLRRSVANIIGEIRQAQLILGHSDMKTTELYLSDDSRKISETLLHYQEGI